MTDIKNRVANELLLDIPIKLPEHDQRIFLPNRDLTKRSGSPVPTTTVTTTNNIHYDYSQRHYHFNISINSNNSSEGKSSGGGGLATVIAIGAIIWLLSQAFPILGGFHSFSHIVGLRW